MFASQTAKLIDCEFENRVVTAANWPLVWSPWQTLCNTANKMGRRIKKRRKGENRKKRLQFWAFGSIAIPSRFNMGCQHICEIKREREREGRDQGRFQGYAKPWYYGLKHGFEYEEQGHVPPTTSTVPFSPVSNLKHPHIHAFTPCWVFNGEMMLTLYPILLWGLWRSKWKPTPFSFFFFFFFLLSSFLFSARTPIFCFRSEARSHRWCHRRLLLLCYSYSKNGVGWLFKISHTCYLW